MPVWARPREQSRQAEAGDVGRVASSLASVSPSGPGLRLRGHAACGGGVFLEARVFSPRWRTCGRTLPLRAHQPLPRSAHTGDFFPAGGRGLLADPEAFPFNDAFADPAVLGSEGVRDGDLDAQLFPVVTDVVQVAGRVPLAAMVPMGTMRAGDSAWEHSFWLALNSSRMSAIFCWVMGRPHWMRRPMATWKAFSQGMSSVLRKMSRRFWMGMNSSCHSPRPPPWPALRADAVLTVLVVAAAHVHKAGVPGVRGALVHLLGHLGAEPPDVGDGAAGLGGLQDGFPQAVVAGGDGLGVATLDGLGGGGAGRSGEGFGFASGLGGWRGGYAARRSWDNCGRTGSGGLLLRGEFGGGICRGEVLAVLSGLARGAGGGDHQYGGEEGEDGGVRSREGHGGPSGRVFVEPWAWPVEDGSPWGITVGKRGVVPFVRMAIMFGRSKPSVSGLSRLRLRETYFQRGWQNLPWSVPYSQKSEGHSA